MNKAKRYSTEVRERAVRLLHHTIVIVIVGNSYRLREHAKLVPESLRLPPITAPAKPRKRRGRPPKKKNPQ